MRNNGKPVKKLIEYFGTQQAVAKALNIKQATVSGWLNSSHGISELNALKAEKATNGLVKAEELCESLKVLSLNNH